MAEVSLIYPHQLYDDHPAIEAGRIIYLVEEALLLTFNPVHIQRLILHKLSMDAYETKLVSSGYQVQRLSIFDYPRTSDVFAKLAKDGVTTIHVADTTDRFLEGKLENSKLTRVWYGAPSFYLTKEDAVSRYLSSKRRMANFYKQLRIDERILVSEELKPIGGKWSFDEDNRKKLPKNVELPDDPSFASGADIDAARKWAKSLPGESYGSDQFWLPYTQSAAQEYLQQFLRERFVSFGPYEDALTTRATRLFHSALSPLMNIGLITPEQVLTETLEYAIRHDVPLNSIEGFVRQILGWREFIRAAYEVDGSIMRTKNFWNHQRSIPKSFWSGDVGVLPLDIAINRALEFGYTHHIERLMVLGNFLLLSEIHPDEVYRWFMGMYVDAYDWVMVPNVYGMSQFADGGLFATKPYISGSNYLKKMSDYPKGDWQELWTALYWNFISTHLSFFKSNHRLSMMPRLFERMDSDKKKRLLSAASNYLDSLS